MPERRRGVRHLVSFPIRVEWKDENGDEVFDEGLTENVGPLGTLIHLQRQLPNVGSTVILTVTENPSRLITVEAHVLRLERNAGHPQAALMIVGDTDEWKRDVWDYAGQQVAAEMPEEFED